MQRGQGRSRGSPSVLVRPHTGQCQPAARTSAASTVESEPSGKRTSTPIRRSSTGSPPQAVRRLTRTELSKASTRPSASMPSCSTVTVSPTAMQSASRACSKRCRQGMRTAPGFQRTPSPEGSSKIASSHQAGAGLPFSRSLSSV